MKHGIFILVTVAILYLVGWTTQAQTRVPTSPRWEYMIIISPGWGKEAEAKLNQLGAEGWQFASYRTAAVASNRGLEEVFLLKREK